MLKLLYNLFDSKEQFLLQAKEIRLSLDAYRFAVCNCLITEVNTAYHEGGQYLDLYQNTLSMLVNMLEKYSSFQIVSLDMKHICIIFEFEADSPYLDPKTFSELLKEINAMIYNYFSVTLFCSVGGYKEDALLIADSHQEARQLLPFCSGESPIRFYQDLTSDVLVSFKNTFNITVLKEDIRKAFEEYDMSAFQYITDSITALFLAHPAFYVQAMDVTSNILHLCLTMLPDSEKYLSEKFSQYRESYRSLYNQKTTQQVMDWLGLFSQSVVEFYHSQYKELKNTLIHTIMQYIESHIGEKLLLNDVAAIFSISPNYLGHLFKKHTALGFNEYVTQMKISRAKYLMFHTDLKIYEIAASLGFENSFYFSKVFKKLEGISPRQYLRNQSY